LLGRCKFVFTLVTGGHLLSVGYIVYSVVFKSGQYFYKAADWTLLSLPAIKFWVMLQQQRYYTLASLTVWKKGRNVCVCATYGTGSAFLTGKGRNNIHVQEESFKI